MSTTLEVKYFNTFWLKKLVNVVAASPQPVPPYTNVPHDYLLPANTNDWYIEEARIRGGYNNTSVDLGVKAYIDETNPLQQHRFNSLIYSGIFNSRTGVNDTNQFSVGEDITKSTDPANGQIMKLYAEDTNLIIFQEDKVSRALIDKDAIYSAEGNPAVTSTNLVIGQIIAYAGEYGISQDPFSFAVYGNRKYFTDRKRGVVLRLSSGVGGGNGITEISSYGMHDFFRDELSNSTTNKIVAGWNSHTKNYVLSIQGTDTFKTLAFDESVLGWTSFFSFKPEYMVSVNNSFYSFKNVVSGNKGIWLHNSGQYGNFYGVFSNSDVTVILNSEPSVVKNFKTINYEGATGWELESMQGSSETGTTGDISLPIALFLTSDLSTLSGLESNLFRLNFKRKENKFFANLQQALVANTTPQYGEVVYGEDVSGIKGFFSTVKFKLNNINFLTTKKELFSVSFQAIHHDTKVSQSESFSTRIFNSI